MNEGKFSPSWDEFQYEQALRRDELRIQRYFAALRQDIDLPGEEKMILHRLLSQPELAPTGVPWLPGDRLREWFPEQPQTQEETEEAVREWEERQSGEGMRRLEALGREWSAFSSLHYRHINIETALRILAQIGKLMSRLGLLNLEFNEAPAPFKIALTKRIITGLNELAGEFETLASENKISEKTLDKFRSALIELHESAVNAMLEWRRNRKPGTEERPNTF